MSLNDIRIYLYRKRNIPSGPITPPKEFKPDLESRMLYRETAYICDHILRLIGKTNTGTCRLFNIMAGEGISEIRIHDLKNIIHIDVPFDFPVYMKSTLEQKQTMVMELLELSFDFICKEKQWDLAVFSEALKTIRQENFQHKFMFGKKTKNTKRDQAYLWLEQDINNMMIYIRVEPKSDQKKVLLVQKTYPSAFDYVRFLGKLKWIDDQHLELSTHSEKTIYSMSDFQDYLI